MQPRFRYDVFISYSWQNSGTAIEIFRCLREQGVLCWIDKEDVPSGVEFQVSIMSGIADAAVLCVIFTPAALESEWVRQEVGTFAKVASMEMRTTETQGITPPRERFIHVLYSISRAEAIEMIDLWTGGSFEKVTYHEIGRSHTPSSSLLSNIKKNVSPSRPVHDALKELSDLQPPYETWFTDHHIFFYRTAAVCLEAFTNSVETLTIHHEDEDSNIRLVTRMGIMPLPERVLSSHLHPIYNVMLLGAY